MKLLLCAVVISFVTAVGMAVASEVSITGTVQQTEEGLVITADDEIYIITGQDLSEMVGKNVKVTGIISESEAGKVINVMSVELLEEENELKNEVESEVENH